MVGLLFKFFLFLVIYNWYNTEIHTIFYQLLLEALRASNVKFLNIKKFLMGRL